MRYMYTAMSDWESVKRAPHFCVFALFLLLPYSAYSQARYDLVILGGRVMDPASGTDAVRNIGIRSGQITAISSEVFEGRETIDASGLVVAPGFIDLHRIRIGPLRVQRYECLFIANPLFPRS